MGGDNWQVGARRRVNVLSCTLFFSETGDPRVLVLVAGLCLVGQGLAKERAGRRFLGARWLIGSAGQKIKSDGVLGGVGI